MNLACVDGGIGNLKTTKQSISIQLTKANNCMIVQMSDIPRRLS